MSAKKPRTDHAKALAAFQGKWITKAEYQACVARRAWVNGRTLFTWDRFTGRANMDWFPSRGKVAP